MKRGKANLLFHFPERSSCVDTRRCNVHHFVAVGIPYSFCKLSGKQKQIWTKQTYHVYYLILGYLSAKDERDQLFKHVPHFRDFTRSSGTFSLLKVALYTSKGKLMWSDSNVYTPGIPTLDVSLYFVFIQIINAAMGRARFMVYTGLINRAAMGRARFMVYTGFIFLTARPWAECGSWFTRGLFFFRRFVGDHTQTSLV